jgi:polar amino acid transport system substrate-binding protein
MSYSVPYTVDPIALVVKKGRSFSYTKWDDLIGKKGVLMTGDSYGQTFDDYIKAKLTTVRVATAEEAIERLEKGEVDYFVYALYSLEKLITEKGLIDAVEVLPRYVASENFYITISHQSPLEKYLGQVNDLIEKYRRDGTIDSLITKNKALFQASLNKAEE